MGGEKLVREVGWHDYFQRVYRRIGVGVREDREEWKTGLGPDGYAEEMPEDLLEERTGLACMDGFAKELHETGYLHNHARLWTASYVVHHRRVRWEDPRVPAACKVSVTLTDQHAVEHPVRPSPSQRA